MAQKATLHVITLNDRDAATYKRRVKLPYVANYRQENWRRGDIIGITNDVNWRYRNGGKVMWDGENAIRLETEGNEYGYNNKKIPVGEFPATYWEDIIDINSLVYAKFDRRIARNVNAFFNGLNNDSYDEELRTYGHHNFEYNGNNWSIVFVKLPTERDAPFDARGYGIFNYDEYNKYPIEGVERQYTLIYGADN